MRTARAALVFEVIVETSDIDLADDEIEWTPQFDVAADLLGWYLRNMAGMVKDVRLVSATTTEGAELDLVLSEIED